MKLRFTVLVVAITVLFAACNRERSTITGSFGEGVLGGRVEMEDGSSPAGMEVAVAGTGMRMVVGEDGSFAFANVPERAELLFHRDSYMASMKVGAGDRSLTVQLGPNGASSGGRRRSSRPGPKVYETEGLVRSASATELVVFDSHRQEVTFVLSDATVIRKGNRMLTPADLVADMRVHVKATLVDDKRTAILVIVQDEEDDEEGEHARKEYEGIVRSVSATELVVFDSHREEVTFVLNDATVIRKGNRALKPEDLKVGDRVHVRATTEGTTKTAILVILQNSGDGEEGEEGETATANGLVIATGASEITVRTQAHGDVTVQVDDATIIRKQGAQIAVTDIQPGDEVNCLGKRVSDTTLLARQIEVRGKKGRP